ncbi:phosphoenolpyruvate--protein phosphotransferase [Microvirga sp. W0021]|uniref:phosphoenolpyruvate--protein phosphotransferase n=1 Tax=Hohaiivirga grylli TaxID=3133970 RepID=A0ABV0BL14_9HYPH
MVTAPGGPRILLRRLREIMAEQAAPQDRLNKIVVQIAANMIAEVCSVYVLRSDNTLELYATEGLNQSAVHRTILAMDEGLVGLIAQTAEPLSLADAQTHEAFSYKPETGEEIYHGFLGVPLLRTGQTLGVLVIQNRSFRTYTEEEIEIMQTTAMILSEMLATGELQAIASPGTSPLIGRPLHIKGKTLADGIGLGHVVFHQPRIVVENLIAEDVDSELRRLEQGISAMRQSIDELIERGDIAHHGEHREVLETFRMLANDQGWLRRLREAIHSGLTAEASVERVLSDNRARMMRQTDEYLRERLHDLDDLSNRLLLQLSGKDILSERLRLRENAILIARSMGPAALLDYEPAKLRGLILEEGGPTSHIAIVAKAMNIPVVGQAANIVSLAEHGDAIIVDGTEGEIHLRPTPDIQASYAQKVRMRARRHAQYRKLRTVPAVTLDGVAITLQMNAGLVVDLPYLEDTGATGIGLFRTELQFMVAERMPTMREQQHLYEAIYDGVNGKPITFRTLDIGGDKILPYMDKVEEENPALGWRAIRIGLDRPGLLHAQVRALLKAANGRPVRIMFPMIANCSEFEQAKAIVERQKAYLVRHGHPLPSEIKLGVMVEVPSLLLELDEICAQADFLSVGTNDLMQFLFAADRENRFVANRFDNLSTPMIRALKRIVDKADKHNCSVTVCGDIGGKPIEALALFGLGFRSLSMTPAAVGPMKALVLKLNIAEVSSIMEKALSTHDDGSLLRQALNDFVETRGIPLPS